MFSSFQLLTTVLLMFKSGIFVYETNNSGKQGSFTLTDGLRPWLKEIAFKENILCGAKWLIPGIWIDLHSMKGRLSSSTGHFKYRHNAGFPASTFRIKILQPNLFHVPYFCSSKTVRFRRSIHWHCSHEPIKTPLEERSIETSNYAPIAHDTQSTESAEFSEMDTELDLEALPEEFIESDASKWLTHRWALTLAMGVAFVICNMDKVNMSVAVIPMAQDLGWSATARGIVQSSFFWGYTLTQVPAGWLSTRIGGEKVLLAGVAVWSLGTFLGPTAAYAGFWTLCISRVLVGLGEGLAPSAATSVLSKQVPASERSRAVTTVFGGLDLGSSVGLLLCGPLIRLYGWPCVFHLFAALGFVWCLIWPILKPSLRDAAVWRSKSTRQKLKYYDDTRTRRKVPWNLILRSPPVWAIISAHFCYNWGYYTLLAWLPSFFELALNLDVAKSSILTVIPYITMTAMTPLVGQAADFFLEKGMGLTTLRKLCQGISFIGPAICMICCAWFTPTNSTQIGTGTVTLMVSLLTAAFGFGAWARAGLYCNHQDISPRFSSALLGLSNTAGAIPGILGVWGAGLLFDRTGNWSTSLFYPIVFAQLFGFMTYSLFANSDNQEWS